MELTALPSDTSKARLPRGFQSGMVIADDQLDSVQPTLLEAAEKLVDFGEFGG
jgi:hypothetical protein